VEEGARASGGRWDAQITALPALFDELERVLALIGPVSCCIPSPVQGKERLDAELEGGLPMSSNMAGLFGDLAEE